MQGCYASVGFGYVQLMLTSCNRHVLGVVPLHAALYALGQHHLFVSSSVPADAGAWWEADAVGFPYVLFCATDLFMVLLFHAARCDSILSLSFHHVLTADAGSW